MKYWKHGIFGLILIGVLLYMYFYLQAVDIHKEYSAVAYSYDNDFEKKTTITLSGKMYRQLFKKPTIIGEITVDHDITYKFELKPNELPYYLFVITDWDDTKSARTQGTITASYNLDKVWVQLNDINKRYQMDGYVFGPASSMHEANELIKELVRINPK